MSSLQTTIDHLKDQNDLLRTDVDTANASSDTILADATQAQANTAEWIGEGEQAVQDATQARQEAETSQAVAEATLASIETVKAQAEAGVPLAQGVADAAEAVVVGDAGLALDPLAAKLKSIASVYGQPSLELDFVNQRYTVQGDAPWLREDLDPATDLTFTRATPKWVFDATGTLVEVPADTMAIDHDPETGECLGVLLEPSRTNTLIHSGDLAQAAWAKYRVSVSQESDSRFGTVNRVTASEDGTHYLIQGTPSTGVQSRYAVVKKVNHRYIGLSFVTIDGGGGSVHAIFDFDTGTFTQSISGSDRGTFPVENLGDGWFRLGIYRNQTYGLRLWFPKEPTGDLQTASADFVADGEEFLVAHTQTETGSYPTSYIPTAGAPVTRAADDFIVDVSGLYNAQAVSGSMSFDPMVPMEYATSNRGAPFGLTDANNSYRNSKIALYLDRGSYNRPALETWGDGDQNYSSYSYRASSLLGESNDSQLVAFSAVSLGLWAVARNGVSSSRLMDANPLPKKIDQLRLRTVNTGFHSFYGRVRNIALYPYAMTEAELIELTTLPEEA